MATSLHQNIHAQLRQILDRPESDEVKLNMSLRLLAKYRSTLIQNTLVTQYGTKVMAGPFAGMDFIERSAEGCHVPKLLGCYEEELHDIVLDLRHRNYDVILNIGCAEGYYAVGLKRLLPGVRMAAYDTNPRAQEACRALALKNGVEVEIGGTFDPGDFAAFAGRRVLVWCDIEGAELDLLEPIDTPALSGMDLVVELHPTSTGHAVHVLPQRFAKTHEIQIREASSHHPQLPPIFQQLGHLDQLLAQWEWRSAPTPWAVMRARNPA